MSKEVWIISEPHNSRQYSIVYELIGKGRALANKMNAQHYEPEILLAGSTIEGRSLASWVAAALRTGLTADCISLEVVNGILAQYHLKILL